jgi:uncharacterized cupredoxin-like copper-binding protein
MKKIVFILSLLLSTILFVGCSSTPQPVEFTVELSEFKFTPNQFEVQVGQEVTFHLVNKGALNHEFMVGRDVMEMEGMPGGFTHNMFEGNEPMVMGGMADEHADEGEHMMDDTGGMDHGFMVMLPNDDPEKSITFTVTENMVGEWEIACFTDGGSHYNQGMTGTLIVNP